jgi:glycosyltransferase involved in cell wall biosynthesis
MIEISIVLGTFNRRLFLAEAIETARKASAALRREIIVVDGGSTDGSIEWLVKQHDIITIVQHNRIVVNGRPVRRRSWGYFMNLAFKAAQGKYVMMISDDCLVVGEAPVAALRHADRLAKSGRKIGGVAMYYRDWPKERDYYVQRTLGGRLMINHGLFLRSALQQIGWADEDTYDFYKADGDMNLRLWEAGYEIVDCPGAFIEHYFDPEEEKRISNSATMQKDREAYAARWRKELDRAYPTRGMGRKMLTFLDPDNTVARWPAPLSGGRSSDRLQ